MEKDIQLDYLDLLSFYNNKLEGVLNRKYGIRVINIDVSNLNA